jgi:hypothetical protein
MPPCAGGDASLAGAGVRGEHPLGEVPLYGA